MAAVARDESKSEENNMIQIKLHKSDLVSIAKADGRPKTKQVERRKISRQIAACIRIKLYDKTCTKEICQRKGKRAIAKDTEKEESPVDPYRLSRCK